METQSNQAEQPGKINVTYESLFDLVVREKGREELQSLSPSFFAELASYVSGKRAMLSTLSLDEKERASRQLQNINRLIKELYERREKKIINLALARSRAAADIIDSSALLAEEKGIFEGLVRQLDTFRDSVLNNLLVAKSPEPGQNRQLKAETETTHDLGTQQLQQDAAGEGERKSVTKLVRFLHPVPKFVGRELEVYGPFEREDVANLPREIADVLIMKGRAEEIASA